MTLRGSALIALWNDRSEHRLDYDVWHTREHVPQRLSVPGFISARRYSEGSGPLPSYFTLYTLTQIGVLSSEAYRRLLEEPTPWSRSMRPDFARFLRLPCTLRTSRGGGLGGWMMAALAHHAGPVPGIDAVLAQLMSLAGVTAVHYATVDRESPGVPFTIQNQQADADGVLIVEGYKSDLLTAAQPQVDASLASTLRLSEHTLYKLAFALEAGERELVEQLPHEP
jgi:hypothetical protein